MTNCAMKEFYAAVTVFNTEERWVDLMYSIHLEVFQIYFFDGFVIRELSHPCSLYTEDVISMQVIQEYI